MTGIIAPGHGLILMKVGVHANEDLASIIARKSKEIDDTGYALWGYGGGTCYPSTMVQPFAREYANKGQKIYLCMHEMASHHYAEQVRADEFSIDGHVWQPIPPTISVLGSRFALAIKGLHREQFELPLARTRVGIGPSSGRPGDKYIKGRADKACLEIADDADQPLDTEEPTMQINLVAELCDPYAVFLRNKV